MSTELPRLHPSRPGTLERAVRRELHRPAQVEHHFASPRVSPVDRATLAALRAQRS